MNYFELFSISTSFSVDQTQLSNTFRALQTQFHPDKFSMGSDQLRLMAIQKSTEINDAYQTLKSSCLRAEYLLQLSGYDIELQKTLQDTGFLMEQMELREKITLFTIDDEVEINAFSKKIDNKVNGIESLIAEALVVNDLDKVADSIRKLKFMLKLQDEIVLLEERLFD